MIKVSIIVPIYNSEKYLEKCLKSILIQSLKEIEIICINDGSTDNSLNIVKNFMKLDKRIVLIDKKNEGVSKARNDGLKIAKGQYILNVDSDDWIEKNYCEELFNKAILNGLDMVVSDIYLDSDKKNIYFRDLIIDDNKIITSKEYLETFFKENLVGYTCNKLIKKELYENIFYPEDISLFEDIIVVSNLIKKSNKIGKLNKAYYHYVENTTSISRKLNMSKIKDTYNCFKKLKDIFVNNENLIFYIREQEIFALINILVNAPVYFKDEEYIKIKKYLINQIKTVDVCLTDFSFNSPKKVKYCYYLILKKIPKSYLAVILIHRLLKAIYNYI